jgi:hypothetical protein
MRRWRFAWAWTVGVTLAFGLAGCGGVDPPPPDEPCQPVPDADPTFRWESPQDLELTWVDMPVTVGGGDEKCVLQRRLTYELDAPRRIKSAYSFHGFDKGDSVESLSVLYAKDGKPLYKRSEHIGEVTAEYDAFDPPQPVGYETDGLILDIVCRVTGNNSNTGNLSARCHLAVYVEFEDSAPPPPPPPPGCQVPPGEPPEPWGPPVDPSVRPAQMWEAHNSAKIVVGDRRGKDPVETLRLLAQALRDAGHCADGPWGKQQGAGDAVAIKAPDGLYEEYHSVGFTDGGYTSRPYKAAWPWRGEPPPPAQCGPPLPPPASEIIVKKHGGTPKAPKFDGTGLVKDFDYCSSVGFVGRGSCPVRPECGDPPCPFMDREACELLTFGVPDWRSDGQIVETGNPWQRKVKAGTWVQVCTGPGIVPEVCSTKLQYGGTE